MALIGPIRLMAFYEFYEYDGTNSADLLDFLQTNFPTGGGPWYLASEENGNVLFAWDNGDVQWGILGTSIGGGVITHGPGNVQAVEPSWTDRFVTADSLAEPTSP